MNGRSAGMPMEVFNSSTTDLSALIMFVVDATKPFSSPAKFTQGCDASPRTTAGRHTACPLPQRLI